MEFEASIELSRLHDALEALSVLSDEAKFVISKEGITSHNVDPANVAEVRVNIKKEAFMAWNYKDAPQEIALIDLIGLVNKLALLQEIKIEEEGEYGFDEGLALTIDESSNQLLLSRGSFTYSKHLSDPAGIREAPEIPITLPVEVRVVGAKVRDALRLIERDSDYSKFAIEDGKLVISTGIGKEDTSPQTKYEIELLNVVSTEAHSLYSMDYLSDLKNPIGKAKEVTLRMGSDYPIKIEYSLYSGSIKIEYTLAPRVET